MVFGFKRILPVGVKPLVEPQIIIIMKRILSPNALIASLVFALLLSVSFDSYAQPAMRMKARKVLKRTTVVIFAAHKKVKQNKVHTGHLARAVAHQRLAKRLFMRRKFRRAIAHSRYARRLAFIAIQKNKGTVDKSWEFNKEENEGMSDLPSDTELDKELKSEMPEAELSDEEVVKGEVKDLDVEDIPAEDYK